MLVCTTTFVSLSLFIIHFNSALPLSHSFPFRCLSFSFVSLLHSLFIINFPSAPRSMVHFLSALTLYHSFPFSSTSLSFVFLLISFFFIHFPSTTSFVFLPLSFLSIHPPPLSLCISHLTLYVICHCTQEG